MSKTTIPSVTYRGPQDSILVVGPLTRINYVFDASNEFTLTPETWEDFYAIMHVDYDALKRNFVCTDDPKASQHLRRVSQMDGNYEVPAEVLAEQAKVDAREAKNQRIKFHMNEYITRVNNDIAYGRRETIPEDLNAEAQKYADERIAEEEANAPENPEIPEVSVSNLPQEEQSTTTSPEITDSAQGNPEPETNAPSSEVAPVVESTAEEPAKTEEPTPAPVVEEAPAPTPPVEESKVEDPTPEANVAKKKSSSK